MPSGSLLCNPGLFGLSRICSEIRIKGKEGKTKIERITASRTMSVLALSEQSRSASMWSACRVIRVIRVRNIRVIRVIKGY